MRSAGAVASALETAGEESIDPLAYGLYTGLAVSYARPFTDSEAYGRLEAKWERFADRPAMKRLHKHLLDDRRTLLAHNDQTAHRETLIWPKFVNEGAAILEARAYVKTDAPDKIRELCAYQEQRFGEAAQVLANKLQTLLGWEKRHEVNLDDELARLRAAARE